MSDGTKIEWTDATWNPARGCTKISPGCKNCYAEAMSERFRGVKGHAFEQGFDLRLVPEKLDAPLHWKNPRQVFVNSMSDLFLEGIPDEYIARVVEVMMQARQHTYQILTKRSQRMRDLLNSQFKEAAQAPHIWWGVSAEDRRYGLPRIAHLRQTDAAMRFVSFEPLLEDVGQVNLTDIHWVIVGGESGHRARAFDLDWACSLMRQCSDQGVACFIKQLGRRPIQHGLQLKLEDVKGADWREWPEELCVRQMPVIDLHLNKPKQ